MKLVTKIILPVLIVGVAIITMFGLISLRSEPPKRTPQVHTKVVETTVVNLHSVPTKVTAHGRVTSSQPIQLFAEVSGTLEKGQVPFKPAQSFSKGDLLLKIDNRQAILNLKSAKSDLLNALATVLPEIKLDFPKEYQVWQDYFNSCEFDKKIDYLPETNNQKIKLFLSRFNVYKLYFSVSNLEILLDKHSFYAPFDGSIVTADIRVGSTARNGSLLGEIINLEEMEVAVPVEADDIQWIDREQQVRLTSSDVTGEWSGMISRIGSHIDTRTQTVDLYIAVENGHNTALLNGVFLTAHIPGKNIDNAFPVPSKAIYEDRYVYLIDDGRLVTKDIVILRKEPDKIIVNGGISDGDTLVIEIMQGVTPGMPAQSKLMVSEAGGR
jgi:multidrug efflux pump subunit AcrA (membrane-fusion protein)